ncbi:MAG: molybdate ABC transporter substrate-binding protein [Clostridia bacterium]|nr:molybdate ABC transporter substrate-binding protein [Clostridia bacterium]
MRKLLMIALCLPLGLLAGCSAGTEAAQTAAASQGAAASGSQAAAETADQAESGQTEVIVFAAASMQETLTEIQELYKVQAPDTEVVCNFDSSGTLKRQIEEGAPCDVFISAAQKQMNQLDDGEDGEEGLHLIDPATRVNLLENKVTLVVPEGTPAGITIFEDLADKLKNDEILVAVGNSDVPVGQYTQRIFEFFGLDEQRLADAGRLSYGTNVKEVTTQVSENSVSCGIIYATDAFSADLEIVAEATPEMCGQVIYPAAVLEAAQDKAAAEALLDYLQTPEAMAVFESVGFSPAVQE